jgi:hypothetical protein
MREKFLSPEPVAIVRCFKYFPTENVHESKPAWGIGEHTGMIPKIDSEETRSPSRLQTLDT